MKIQYVCPQCSKTNDSNTMRCDCGRPLRLEIEVKPDDLKAEKKPLISAR